MRSRNGYGLTDQEEAFCQALARGRTLKEASIAAGYDGDTSNAHRRSEKPKIKARIDLIRYELRENLKLQDLDRRARHLVELQERGVSFGWIVDKLMDNINNALSDGKYRESTQAIKVLAELGGYLKSGTDNEPNKHKASNDSSNNSPSVAIQVVNQYPDLAERLARARLEAGAGVDEAGDEADNGDQLLLGPASAAQVVDLGGGAAAEPLFEPAEGSRG